MPPRFFGKDDALGRIVERCLCEYGSVLSSAERLQAAETVALSLQAENRCPCKPLSRQMWKVVDTAHETAGKPPKRGL